MWDTIHAISTPEGVSITAIVRISGEEAIALAQKLTPKTSLENWCSFSKGKVWLQIPGFAPIPSVLFLMKKPASYTREDIVEFHLPGAVPLLQALSAHLVASGARVAYPGEFTQRAYLNGRISLTQAEGILEMIHAENQAQIKAALQQVSGKFHQEITLLREQITMLMAKIEANIDFAYHGDVEIDPDVIPLSLQELQNSLKQLVSQKAKIPQMSQGIPVALIGPPNAGKSTLFNTLTGKDYAIISEQAGTTRDILDAPFSWKTYSFRLYDTAGIEAVSENIVQNKAQAFRQRVQEHAQLCLFLADPIQFQNPSILAAYQALPDPKLLILNKCDLSLPTPDLPFPVLKISAKEGIGIDALKDRLVEKMASDKTSLSGYGYLLNARQSASLQQSLACIERAQENATTDLDFIAFELREAANHLAVVTGEIVSEDVLTQIFAQFCIGK